MSRRRSSLDPFTGQIGSPKENQRRRYAFVSRISCLRGGGPGPRSTVRKHPSRFFGLPHRFVLKNEKKYTMEPYSIW